MFLGFRCWSFLGRASFDSRSLCELRDSTSRSIQSVRLQGLNVSIPRVENSLLLVLPCKWTIHILSIPWLEHWYSLKSVILLFRLRYTASLEQPTKNHTSMRWEPCRYVDQQNCTVKPPWTKFLSDSHNDRVAIKLHISIYYKYAFTRLRDINITMMCLPCWSCGDQQWPFLASCISVSWHQQR